MKLTAKSALSLLLLTIPFNFIAIKGIGNVYLSTLVILIEFFFLFLVTGGNILAKKNILIVSSFFVITLLTTIINVTCFDSSLIEFQITNTVIYFQNTVVFIVCYYLFDKIELDYFYKLFVVIAFIGVLRIFIEEPNHIFKMSLIWGERIEAYFIGGVNNFSLILGIAFLISFFYLKNKFLKITSCILLMLVIVLGMSRGALLGVILTLFFTFFYYANKRTLKLFFRYSLYFFLIGLLMLVLLGEIDVVIEKVQDRFFSLFTNEKSANQFFSARGDLISDMFGRLSNSSLFQILFGHGNGSIDFFDKISKQRYETSHNILIDLLYRNGILILGLYVLTLIYVFLIFIKNREKKKLTLFAIFIFFHLELLVNPIVFAAQVGWLYAVFMALFIKQNLSNNHNKQL